MGFRDVLSPFTAWKHVVDTPVTIKNPIGREAADRYRGRVLEQLGQVLMDVETATIGRVPLYVKSGAIIPLDVERDVIGVERGYSKRRNRAARIEFKLPKRSFDRLRFVFK